MFLKCNGTVNLKKTEKGWKRRDKRRKKWNTVKATYSPIIVQKYIRIELDKHFS